MSAVVPYVIGQWVRGTRFYGRRRELASLLSPDRAQWIAGLRRMGKTSLLRQLELIATETARDRPIVPLFWDLQGVDTEEELGLSFADALLDSRELLARHRVLGAELADADLRVSCECLLRRLKGAEIDLWLLCDEADEVMGFRAAASSLVQSVWRAVLEAPGGRLVIASSLRLCDRAATDPLVKDLVRGFASPIFCGALPDDEARALLRQTQLPEEARPALDRATVESIAEECGNHPMLLQILGRRHHELGDLGEVLRQVAADRMLPHMFAIDFDLLVDFERDLLRTLAAREPSLEIDTVTEGAVHRLEALGLVRRSAEGWRIPNRFFASWLRCS